MQSLFPLDSVARLHSPRHISHSCKTGLWCVALCRPLQDLGVLHRSHAGHQSAGAVLQRPAEGHCGERQGEWTFFCWKLAFVEREMTFYWCFCSQGAASMKEFYAKNSRWTEGLISASKAVGWGATMLVWVTQTVRKSNLGGGKLWHSDLKISVAQWNPLYFFQNYFVFFPF